MDYKQIMMSLPVSINSIRGIVEDENYFDARVGEVSITATNIYIPIGGNLFVVTFEGRGWQESAVEAINQLGEPNFPLDMFAEKQTLGWKSKQRGTPTPIQIRRLGWERFSRIVKKHSLQADEAPVLKDLLVVNAMTAEFLDSMVKTRDELVAYLLGKLGKKKARRRVMEAWLEVEAEFARFMASAANN